MNTRNKRGKKMPVKWRGRSGQEDRAKRRHAYTKYAEKRRRQTEYRGGSSSIWSLLKSMPIVCFKSIERYGRSHHRTCFGELAAIIRTPAFGITANHITKQKGAERRQLAKNTDVQ